MTEMAVETISVPPLCDGKRLDVFLSEELDDVSRSRAGKFITDAGVTVNGGVILKRGYSLKENDIITVNITEPEAISAKPQNIPINVIGETRDYAVIDKPRGMVTHPAAGSPDGTLVNALLFKIKDLSSINGAIRPGIVHRLDKNTSGLIVIAKNDAAHVSLSSQIADKTAGRTYIGIVDGNIKEDNGIIEEPIGRDKKDRKSMAVAPGGRYAKTAYKVLERFGAYTLVEFKLFTGRTHQIRVHCKHIKHPLLGDTQYGGSDNFNVKGQLLHAFKLEFNDPSTGERMYFESNLPDYFEKILTKLRNTCGSR